MGKTGWLGERRGAGKHFCSCDAQLSSCKRLWLCSAAETDGWTAWAAGLGRMASSPRGARTAASRAWQWITKKLLKHRNMLDMSLKPSIREKYKDKSIERKWRCKMSCDYPGSYKRRGKYLGSVLEVKGMNNIGSLLKEDFGYYWVVWRRMKYLMLYCLILQ